MKLGDVLLDNLWYAHSLSAIAGFLVSLLIALLLFTSCTCKPAPTPPPPPPTVADLHFPVVVLYPNTYTALFKDATDLHTMLTNLVISLDEPPLLIDSNFLICTMPQLKTIHGGLWLMTHPVGLTEVTFNLARAPKSGLDAARAAMSAQLDKQTWLHSADSKKSHTALDRQTTLQGMYNTFPKDEMTPPP